MVNNNIQFEFKNQVRSGIGLTRKLSEIIKEYSFKKIGFVIDGNLLDAKDWLHDMLSNCKKEFDTVIIHEYREKFEPTYQYLDKNKGLFKKNEVPIVDCIIGIGGGSTLDSAKGFATLATNHDDALTYRGFPIDINSSIPIITIPSTAGTGSEAVYFAVFIDADTDTKLGINTPNNYPLLSILDPEVVAGAPESVLISSGVDALVHTLESFVSVKSSFISRMFSMEAFNLIINHFPRIFSDNSNLKSWEGMQWGAYLATIALSNSSAGPAGALSYHLGTNYNVPHGIAGGVFLRDITRLNHNEGFHNYSQLYPFIPNADPTIQDNKMQSECVVNAIESLLDDLNVPCKLDTLGVPPEDYDSFYKYSTETIKAAFDFNPVKFDNDKIAIFLKSMMNMKEKESLVN